jgi:hypothetical protein
MISIGFSKAIKTTTRIPRPAEREVTPQETSGQTGITSVREPETTLVVCVLQFIAVYVPVLLSEYLLLYIVELGH